MTLARYGYESLSHCTVTGDRSANAALATVKERTQDAEWVGMAAVADAVDGIVTLTMPAIPQRGRLVGPAALGAAFLGLKLSRELADARVATPDPT